MTVLDRIHNRSNYSGKPIIFTSFYQCQAHSRYTKSMVDTVQLLERLGINYEYLAINGNFHVERACNEAVSYFMADEEATDLLIIDSDESWDVMAVMRLLMRPEEVVGCAYRMKNGWKHYTVKLEKRDGQYVGKILKDGTALLRAERLPAGFMRLKKSAVQKYIDAFPDNWCWSGDKEHPRKVYWLFQTDIRNHEFFSQDFNLSEKFREIGVELWCDPNADISHHGTTEYPGNLDKQLRAEKQESKERAAFAEVKRMAEEIQARAA